MMEKDTLDLIAEHLPLVRSVVKEYTGYGVSFDDLFQEGVLGLIEAQKRFDPGRETKFSTYATYWVKKKVLETLSNENKESHSSLHEQETEAVTGPGTVEQKVKRMLPQIYREKSFPGIEKKILGLSLEQGKPLNEIGEILGMSRERVRQLKKRALRRIKKNTESESGL